MKPVKQKLNLFIKELVNGIKDDAVSVVLLGSAADCTWKEGVSDIDLFIVAKNKRKGEVLKKLFFLFLKLDKKYGLGLSRISFGRGENIFVKLFIQFEYYFLYNVPYYVVEEDGIILNGFFLKDWKARFLSFFGSMKVFGLELKRNGIVIYGKDIIKKIRIPPINEIDRLKFFFSLFAIFLLGLLVFPVSSSIGRRHLDKVIKRYEIIKRMP